MTTQGIVIEQSGLRPPGPDQGGVAPLGTVGAWRGLAITRLPDGSTRTFEQWFTKDQISHSIAGCNRMLEESAIRDARQYAGDAR